MVQLISFMNKDNEEREPKRILVKKNCALISRAELTIMDNNDVIAANLE